MALAVLYLALRIGDRWLTVYGVSARVFQRYGPQSSGGVAWQVRGVTYESGGVGDHGDAAGVVEQGGQDGVDGTARARDEAGEVDADGECVVLPHDAQGVPAEFHDGGDITQVVAGQGDVGGLECGLVEAVRRCM
jgi:hypothetical protein